MSKLHGMAKRDARSTAIAATVFLFPAVALLLIYMVYPIIDTFLISRLKWNGFYTAEKINVGWENWTALINDRLFLQLVWDSYAWAVRQCFRVPKKDGTYRDIPGIDLYYSGDFSLWRLAYFCVGAMRDIFQQVGLGFQELYNLGPDQEVPYLTYEQWSNLVRNTTDQIIAEQNLQPMIDEVWNARTPEDYSEYYSKVKAAFEAEWHHSRTKAGKGMQSLERLMETSDGRRQILALSDESDFAEEVIYRLWSQRFLETLPPKDRKILQLKTAGFTVQEIAERAGYKTHSAVVKRLRKIREKFEGFILSGS